MEVQANMAGAHEALEHAEHMAHAGHEGGEHKSKLGTWVGLTMGILGVLLALTAAKVGGERTELVESMVAQQNANSRYQSQDVKHRMAVLALSQVHATIPGAGEAAAPGARAPNKKDVVDLARTVQRYLHESQLAKAWLESYDPEINAHIEAQEHYETGQLLAEIGIVLASIALLTHKKLPWLVAVVCSVVGGGRPRRDVRPHPAGGPRGRGEDHRDGQGVPRRAQRRQDDRRRGRARRRRHGVGRRAADGPGRRDARRRRGAEARVSSRFSDTPRG